MPPVRQTGPGSKLREAVTLPDLKRYLGVGSLNGVPDDTLEDPVARDAALNEIGVVVFSEVHEPVLACAAGHQFNLWLLP